MRNLLLLLFMVFTIHSSSLFGQSNLDSLSIKIGYTDSPELLDYFRFEGIDYNKVQIFGKDIKNKYYLLTSNNYVKGNLIGVDTLCYLKPFGMRNNSDTISIKVMSKKTNSDTVKFQFNNMSRMVTTREFPTTRERYSLRVIQGSSFHRSDSIDLLAYSLPTTKHNNELGGKSYCALTDDGVKTTKLVGRIWC